MRIAIPFLVLCFFLLPGGQPCCGMEQKAAAKLDLEVFTICRNIVDRTPLGIASEYPASVSKLYCFTKVVGARGETEIIHNWYMNGKLKGRVVLPVESASWRTWSLKEIKATDAGDWMVEVTYANGDPIESILFFIR